MPRLASDKANRNVRNTFESFKAREVSNGSLNKFLFETRGSYYLCIKQFRNRIFGQRTFFFEGKINKR